MGQALPAAPGSPPSFPIPNVDYLKRAIRSVGRAPASKRPALAALIRKRAKELKATNAPGVKGTWAFQAANDGPAVELTGPKGYSHGWVFEGTKGQLVQHMTEHHSGVPAGGRRVGPKSPSIAQLQAGHAEQHRMRGDLDHTHPSAPDLSTREGRAAAVAKADIGTPAGRALVARAQRASLASASTTRLAAEHGKVIEMAAARRMPKVRGAADVQMSRSGPGTITVQHKSTGMKVGTLAAKGRGYQGTHASGVKAPASGSQQGALAGLIAVHNRLAAGSKSGTAMVPAQQMGVAASNDDGKAVDLAGSLPVTSNASSSDGPRVTTMGSGKPAGSGGPSGLSPYAQAVYKKLIAKGMKPAQAEALARRAAAMHQKAAA
jgi:hypothetical protein